MGLFSFFKKVLNADFDSQNLSEFTCDFITGLPSCKGAVVRFDNAHPGMFLVNETPYEAGFQHIEDIGLCRENKYERIAADGWIFYLQKGCGRKFMNALMAARNQSLSSSISKIQERPFSDYIPPESLTYEACVTFNLSGVSYDYGVSTRNIIESLPIGSKLSLRLWPDAPNNKSRICVFDPNNHQIGYMEIWDEDIRQYELYKQLLFGVPFTAKVEEKGTVQGTSIKWCRATVYIKLPYPKDSEIVYSSGFGKAYHCKKGCCGVTDEIPLYLAEKYRMSPCKRCHKIKTP